MKVEVIGVIGQGFVGTAVREKFRELFPVMAYDKYNEDLSKTYDSKKSLDHVNTLSDLVDNCDYLFSCVPTPMYEDGECDTRIVESVIMDLHHECIKKEKTVTVVCKSTMTPGTTERLNEISKFVEVLFSPEFLTEANAVEDFKNQNRIILGLPKSRTHNPSTRSLITSTFQKAFPNANVLTIDATEAEMVKYMTNLFLATKVSFFNDMYSYCQKIGANYNVISEVTLLDNRIGNSHYQVPGPDGDRGFGGHCFPGNYTIKTPNGNIALEEAYEKYTSGELLECLSFDHNVENLETKIVKEVTKNYYEGELLTFELENGTSFKCTPEHIFPINRNGNLMLVQAKNILESDNFYNVSEYINKNQKALTYDNELFRREEKH